MITRRDFLPAAIFGAGVAAGGLGTWLGSHDRRPREGRQRPRPAMEVSLAVSLMQYQRELAAVQRGGRFSDALRTVYGLNRITGIVYLPGSDVLLLGDSAPGIPGIELDDWLVALRNAYRAAPEYDGAIGCTIDPIPGVDDPWRIQEAKVFGMPATAPMGARHVAIDYELKKISAGLLPVSAHVTSVFEQARDESVPCRNGGGIKQRSTMHRFWFTPRYPDTRPRFVQSEQAVWIRNPIGVRVQSEQEFLDHGRRVGSAPPDPGAERFCQSVTDLLATDEVRQYVRLRNDFRVIEVARVMHAKGVAAELLHYLLYACPLGVDPAPAKVGGIQREEEGRAVCGAQVAVVHGATGSRTTVTQNVVNYRNEYRGGVEAAVKVEQADFGHDNERSIAAVVRCALRARPRTAAPMWQFAV